ncbi:MAG: hypothetical protein R3F24_14880 [Gammaproteobacteria bacterium]
MALARYAVRVVFSFRMSCRCSCSCTARISIRDLSIRVSTESSDFNLKLAADAAGNFRAEVPEASGTLFDRPLRLSGIVTRDARSLTVDNVVLASGVNRVEANGRWGERIAGRFSLDAPDLATLWPGLSGQQRARAPLPARQNNRRLRWI